jgi:hypothetical protein
MLGESLAGRAQVARIPLAPEPLQPLPAIRAPLDVELAQVALGGHRLEIGPGEGHGGRVVGLRPGEVVILAGCVTAPQPGTAQLEA